MTPLTFTLIKWPLKMICETLVNLPHLLVQFSYDGEDITAQAAASAAITTTNSLTNNANTNNDTMKDINTNLIPSITTTTTTNNSANNANTNNSTINGANSNLIPSSVDEKRNESEECEITYAAQQDVKEKFWF